MAMAADLPCSPEATVGSVAEKVGYAPASTAFGAAFERAPKARGGWRFLLALLMLLAEAGVRAQDCEALIEYDEIVAVVTERFFDQTFNGLGWPDRVAEHRGAIGCTDGPARVAAVVNSLLAELAVSHTALYTREDMHYWGLNSLFAADGAYEIDFSGIWPEQEDGRWFARHVLEGSPAAAAGVLVGDELSAIDGRDFSPLGFGPGRSSLTLSSDGRSVRTVSFATRRQSVMHGFVEAASASERILSVGDERVGYFHLWTARDAILERMNAALDRFENDRVDALVMDYRGGYGGTSEDYLTRLRERSFWRTVPKYFLIDDSVRSGKEMLAGIVRRDGLGTLAARGRPDTFWAPRRFASSTRNTFCCWRSATEQYPFCPASDGSNASESRPT